MNELIRRPDVILVYPFFLGFAVYEIHGWRARRQARRALRRVSVHLPPVSARVVLMRNGRRLDTPEVHRPKPERWAS